MSKDIIKQEKHELTANPKDTHPQDTITLAIERGADLEKLEKLLAIQERWELNNAKKAYNESMSAFKANPPKIEKDRKVGYSTSKGNIGYSHATLSNVTDKINKALSLYGLSASWTTKQDGQVSVTCKITHKLGHSEETTLSAPSDTSGSKNAIQAIGSTISYLQRYTLLSITGLATHDMDDDGVNACAKYIDDEKVANIEALISEVKADKTKLLEYAKADSIEKILESDYKKIVVALENRRKQQ